MKKLWIVFVAIFVCSFGVLGWVGTEIFRQAPPIPRSVVTTDGLVLLSGDDMQNGQNVWQAMGGMEMGSIWGHGSYVAPDWTADYLHRESLFILDDWSKKDFGKQYDQATSEQQAMLRQRLQDVVRKNNYDATTGHDQSAYRALLHAGFEHDRGACPRRTLWRVRHAWSGLDAVLLASDEA